MKPLSRTKQQSPRDPEAPGALQHEDFTTCAASVYPVTSEEEKNDHQETQRDVKRKHAVSTKPCLLSNARIFSLWHLHKCWGSVSLTQKRFEHVCQQKKMFGFWIILDFGYCSWVYFCSTNLFSEYVEKVWVLLKFFKIQKVRLRRLALARNSFESFAWEQVAVLHTTGSLWGLCVNQIQAALVQPKPTLLPFTARTLFMKQREGGFSVPRGLVKIHQTAHAKCGVKKAQTDTHNTSFYFVLVHLKLAKKRCVTQHRSFLLLLALARESNHPERENELSLVLY